MSSTSARELASKAEAAGAQGVERISKLGNYGTHPNNCWRDFRRFAKRALQVDYRTYDVLTRVRDPDGSSVSGVLPVLLPHELISLVYDHNLGAFHDICGTGGLAHFWREYERATPEFSDHPAFPLVKLDATSFIPCRIFEDDGGIGKHRGMTIAHWSPLLSVQSTTLDVCFPSYVMHSDSSLGLTTSGPLIEALTWSWNVCLSGVWPRRDHRGELMTGWRLEFADRPLAGGFKFVCTHICMDWKASAEAFHLPWSFNNIGAEAGICHLCHWTCAGPEVHSRFHLHDYGPCRSTFLYLLSPSAGLSPWAALPGFGLYQIVGELMHCDCLGVCVYTIGSALVEFCRCGWFGGRILVRRAGLSWKERLDLQLLCAYKRFKDFLKNRGRNCSWQIHCEPARDACAGEHAPDQSEGVKRHVDRGLACARGQQAGTRVAITVRVPPGHDAVGPQFFQQGRAPGTSSVDDGF